MSMRSDFENILASYGHDVLLNRRVQNAKGAPVYSDVFERHTTRHMVANNRGLSTAEQQYREGLLNSSERVYYFKHDVHPFEGDRIYEEDPRTVNNQTVWEIDAALPLRGDGGAIVYYAVGVTRIRPN